MIVESSSSGWEGFKEQMFDVADAVGARLEGGDRRTATRTTTPTPETAGERLMREFESIKATSSPSSVIVDDNDDGASELAEARRKADEAESMLRIAEEEAARWERELADVEEETASAEAAEPVRAVL
mgnify:CR=1 FL=1